MVAIKFWTCSKQSQKGRLGGRSNEAEGTQRHRHGCRMNAQWSANDSHVIYAFYCKAQPLNVGDVSASPLPLMACFERWQWRPLCLHSATMATLEYPCQWFCLLSASFMRLAVPPHPVFKCYAAVGHPGHIHICITLPIWVNKSTISYTIRVFYIHMGKGKCTAWHIYPKYNDLVSHS